MIIVIDFVSNELWRYSCCEQVNIRWSINDILEWSLVIVYDLVLRSMQILQFCTQFYATAKTKVKNGIRNQLRQTKVLTLFNIPVVIHF